MMRGKDNHSINENPKKKAQTDKKVQGLKVR